MAEQGGFDEEISDNLDNDFTMGQGGMRHELPNDDEYNLHPDEDYSSSEEDGDDGLQPNSEDDGRNTDSNSCMSSFFYADKPPSNCSRSVDFT